MVPSLERQMSNEFMYDLLLLAHTNLSQKDQFSPSGSWLQPPTLTQIHTVRSHLRCLMSLHYYCHPAAMPQPFDTHSEVHVQQVAVSSAAGSQLWPKAQRGCTITVLNQLQLGTPEAWYTQRLILYARKACSSSPHQYCSPLHLHHHCLLDHHPCQLRP